MQQSEQSRVQKACQRCRRQKLKCDAQRPCFLCTRAGAECIEPTPSSGTRKRHNDKSDSPIIKRRQTAVCFAGPAKKRPCNQPTKAARNSASSAVIDLVKEVLTIQSAQSTSKVSTSAIPGGQDADHAPGVGSMQHAGTYQDIVSCLPTPEALNLLVDTFFDRVHWFLLVFEQEPFRRRVQELLLNQEAKHSLPFVASVAAVLLIGLQYIGSHRQQKLASLAVDAKALQVQLHDLLRQRFLDIVAVRSLETVHTCILMGTYYLFHGEPTTAWPVIGAGVSAANAIKLESRYHVMSDENETEARIRCWWALFEIETFCTMSYGYDSSINEPDCLMSLPGKGSDFSALTRPSGEQLLQYKGLMAKLSVMIKRILVRVYHDTPMEVGHSIEELNHELDGWYADLPSDFRRQDLASSDMDYETEEDLERDIRASSQRFETHLLKLQWLALKLAYNNTKILLHRPLLTSTNADSRMVSLAVERCKSAAISTSSIGKEAILPLAARSYAVAFIGMHLFTAGVVLAVIGKRDPLGPDVHEVKAGLRDLIKTQSTLLRAKSNAVTAQGLEILKNLAKSLMDSELSAILGSEVNDGEHEEQDFSGVVESNKSGNDQPTEQAVLPSSEALGFTTQDLSMPSQDLELSWLDDTYFTQEQAWLWSLDFPPE